VENQSLIVGDRHIQLQTRVTDGLVKTLSYVPGAH